MQIMIFSKRKCSMNIVHELFFLRPGLYHSHVCINQEMYSSPQRISCLTQLWFWNCSEGIFQRRYLGQFWEWTPTREMHFFFRNSPLVVTQPLSHENPSRIYICDIYLYLIKRAMCISLENFRTKNISFPNWSEWSFSFWWPRQPL